MAGKQGRPRRQGPPAMGSTPKEVIPTEEKVIEKTAPKVNQEPKIEVKQTPRQAKGRTYTIFVKGKQREVSKPTYDALKKDVKLQVTLPKNSPLVEPPAKPCKDC